MEGPKMSLLAELHPYYTKELHPVSPNHLVDLRYARQQLLQQLAEYSPMNTRMSSKIYPTADMMQGKRMETSEEHEMQCKIGILLELKTS
jgi:predicted RNA-binding protein with PIN domain